MSRWQRVLVCSVAFALGVAGAAGAGSGGLDQRIDIDLEDADVRQMLQSFGEILDAEEVVIDPALDGELDIRLENVRLETVLNAACDSIGCVWSLEDGVLRFEETVPAEGEAPPSGLDEAIDLALEDAPVRQVLESFASTLGAEAAIDESVGGTVTVHLENVPIRRALDQVCKRAGCRWELTEGEDGPVLRFEPR